MRYEVTLRFTVKDDETIDPYSVGKDWDFSMFHVGGRQKACFDSGAGVSQVFTVEDMKVQRVDFVDDETQ